MRYEINILKPYPDVAMYEVLPAEDGEGLNLNEVINFFVALDDNYDSLLKNLKPDKKNKICIKDSNEDDDSDTAYISAIHIKYEEKLNELKNKKGYQENY